METVRVLLISTYDLGRQPFGLASPAAWLRNEGVDVDCVDTSRDTLNDGQISEAGLIAFYLPMHTATRLAAPLIARVRRLNPSARLAAYGLVRTAQRVVAPRARHRACARARSGSRPRWISRSRALRTLNLTRAQTARSPRAEPAARACASSNPIARRCRRWRAMRRCRCPTGPVASSGSTDATRGCKHLCRHCPIVPVYGGTFRAIPLDVVIDDVRAQVAAGAQHISFGDPDFLNGPTHARRLVEAVASEFPRSHLRRDDQGRTHPAPRRHARPPARHGLPHDHERRRIGRRRGAPEAAEGTHARRFHQGRRTLQAGGRDA